MRNKYFKTVSLLLILAILLSALTGCSTGPNVIAVYDKPKTTIPYAEMVSKYEVTVKDANNQEAEELFTIVTDIGKDPSITNNVTYFNLQKLAINKQNDGMFTTDMNSNPGFSPSDKTSFHFKHLPDGQWELISYISQTY